MGTISLIILAVIGGIAITLQGQFMGTMDTVMGSWESVFITYASGGAVVSLLMLLGRGGNLRAWGEVPWYAFSSGLLGLVIVGSIGYVIPRLGVAKGFTLIVASQFLLAALIDQFGWFGAAVRPLDLPRVVGLLIMSAGVWLVVR
jgi:transporter family-2 protein